MIKMLGEEYFNIDDIAEMSQLSAYTVREYFRTKAIIGFKFGKSWLCDKESLEKFWQDIKNKPEPEAKVKDGFVHVDKTVESYLLPTEKVLLISTKPIKARARENLKKQVELMNLSNPKKQNDSVLLNLTKHKTDEPKQEIVPVNTRKEMAEKPGVSGA